MKEWWRCEQPVLGRNLVYLRWVGGCPPDPDPDGRTTATSAATALAWLAFALHFGAVVGPQLGLCVFQLLHSLLEDHSAEGLSSTLGHVSSELYLVLSMVLYLRHRRRLQRVAASLDGLLDECIAGGSGGAEDVAEDLADDGSVRSEARAMLRSYGLVHRTLLTLCTLQGPIVMFLPLVLFLVTRDAEHLFVMRVWAPVSALPAGPRVLAHFAVHAYILGTFNASFGALNSLVFNLLLGLRGSFRCVAAQFRALAAASADDADLHRRFLRAAMTHQRVLVAARQVDGMFSTLFLIKVFCILMMLVFAGFQISKGLSNVPYFVVQLILEGFNFYILCLGGHEILTESEAVLRALQHVPFVGMPPRFKKDLLLAMTAATKPHRMHIGRYAALSMETFKWAMKTAWSCYAVLDASTGGSSASWSSSSRDASGLERK